ncbi:hypothetical protein KPL74_18740 [Bacillus sp. NP157]|nr:hypothetical protein KPL74_18740 [Bacillus sp. NP157]
MKMLVAGLVGLLGVGALSLPQVAEALPSKVNSYVFYSGSQVVGQSILYCNGVQQHWGDARSNNLANAVSVTFSCSSGETTHVAYPAGLDPSAKANFCSQSGLCEVGPWPVNGAGTLQNGLYSD